VAFSSAKAFQDFDRSVRGELRYLRTAAQEEFLAAVIATSDARAVQVKAGYVFWRAQLGHDWREEEVEGGHTFEVQAPHPRNE
jgi:hypothetical protein